MNLSSSSLTILKNFASINPGIFFRVGNTLKTISPAKNILAIADIEDNIESDFGIYDLNNFLSLISMHKDGSELQFDDKHVKIIGNSGRSKIKYRFCHPDMIETPPEKEITMDSPEISFKLTSEDFAWILKVANILLNPQVAIFSDGGIMGIKTFDLENDSAHTESLEIGESNGHIYQMVFNTSNLMKILPGEYDVQISSQGIACFKNSNIPLTYYVAVERGSNYE